MRVLLLAIYLCLGISASAQTFRWDNEQSTSSSTATTQEPVNPMADEVGFAHAYPDYYEGSRTALGETFHHDEMVAAHKTLALGTIVRISRADNGMSTTVRINDRGAYCDECVIDLSRSAAQAIDLNGSGRVRVTLTVMGASTLNPINQQNEIQASADPQWSPRGIVEPTPKEYERTVELRPVEAQAIPSEARVEPQENQPQLQVKGVVEPPVIPTTAKGEVTFLEAPISNYAVQLGAYSNYDNAERHVFRLQELGFDNVYVLKERNGAERVLNRVIIAPFYSIDDAEDYVADLEDYHEMEGLVFQTKLVEVED